MPARRGSFSGGGSLDPFGSGRGGLGRYNITGETVSSLAAYETYAIEVAWANGTATDAEYLAQLQKMIDLAPTGTRERVSAENKLHDAQYSIGRNELVRSVNASISHDSRQSSLSTLLSFEQAYLGTMTATDSQAYRNQQDRIAGVASEIRSDRYSALVEQVNRGKASSSQLLELARALGREAAATTAPDTDQWNGTVESLLQRVQDESTAKKYQDYQHNRINGDQMLAYLDSQIANFAEGSPAWKQLTASREDLATQVGDQNKSKAEATIQQQRSAGTLKDADYLTYLRSAFSAATPGTSDYTNASTRLSEFTFSLAEDKLRYEVSTKKRPVGDLVKFYQSYLKTMDPGSERFRTISGAIYSLSHGGSGGGGGGGGRGGSSGSAILNGPPLINGKAALADLIYGKNAPAGLADLFRINPMNKAAYGWWTLNQKSMKAAFADGASSWTYYEPNQAQTPHVLPFNRTMMLEVDNLDQTYSRIGILNSKDIYESQKWTRALIDGSNDLQAHGATTSKENFDKTWAMIETQKRQLLAGGELAAYYNLAMAQNDYGERLRDNDPYLTNDDRDRINTALAKIGPHITDPLHPAYGDGNVGDPKLNMFKDGTIKTDWGPNHEAMAAYIDPMRGYQTQLKDGAMGIVSVDWSDPAQHRIDPENGREVPAYFGTRAAVQVKTPFGGLTTVWQEVGMPGSAAAQGTALASTTTQTLPAYIQSSTPGVGGGGRSDPNTARATGATVPLPAMVGGINAYMPVYSIQVVENGKVVTWVSLTDPTKNGSAGGIPGGKETTGPATDWKGNPIAVTHGFEGNEWIQIPPGSYGDPNALPRIVLPKNVVAGANGGWLIDGKEGTWVEVLAAGARFWNSSDTLLSGQDFGSPGTSFVHRKTGSNGALDLGSTELDLEMAEIERFSPRGQAATISRNKQASADLAYANARVAGSETARIRAASTAYTTERASGLARDNSYDNYYRPGGLLPISEIKPAAKGRVFGIGPLAFGAMSRMGRRSVAELARPRVAVDELHLGGKKSLAPALKPIQPVDRLKALQAPGFGYAPPAPPLVKPPPHVGDGGV